MPLFRDTNWDEFSRWVIYKLTEPDEELLKQLDLNQTRLAKYQSLSEKRAREYLGLRLCLKRLDMNEVDVEYNEKGKPVIPNTQHLSITHSHGMVGVGLSDFSIGVDLELERPDKIWNIKKKFIRPEEDFFSGHNSETEYLHVIWGIKESLYKLTGGHFWNFLHHYYTEPFELKENEPIQCWVTHNFKSRKYFAYYRKLENYYFVWVVDYI